MLWQISELYTTDGHETEMTLMKTDNGIAYFRGPNNLKKISDRPELIDQTGVIPGIEVLFNVSKGRDQELRALQTSPRCRFILSYLANWCKHCHKEVELFISEKDLIHSLREDYDLDLVYAKPDKYPIIEEFTEEWYPQFIAFCTGKPLSVLYGPVTPAQFAQFVKLTYQHLVQGLPLPSTIIRY